MKKSNHFSPEVRERAVRMVQEHRGEYVRGPDSHIYISIKGYRRPYNMRHTYATIMLMTGMNHAFCAKQLGHSIEMFQRTYSKWIDGEQNDREMDRLEATLSPAYPRKQNKAP